MQPDVKWPELAAVIAGRDERQGTVVLRSRVQAGGRRALDGFQGEPVDDDFIRTSGILGHLGWHHSPQRRSIRGVGAGAEPCTCCPLSSRSAPSHRGMEG